MLIFPQVKKILMRYPRLSIFIIALVIVGFSVMPAIAVSVVTPAKTSTPVKTIAPVKTTPVKGVQYIPFSPPDKSFSANVPSNWTYETDSWDIFSLYSFTDPVTDSWFAIIKGTPPGNVAALEQFKTFRLENPPSDLADLKVISVVSTKFLNSPAYMITMTGNFAGKQRKILEILTMKNGSFYDVYFNSPAEKAISDKKIFDSVISSIKA